MKLVIDRVKWLRGEGTMASRLLRSQDKKMCCIGFLCRAYGVLDGALEDVRSSQDLLTFDLPAWLKDNDFIGAGKYSDLFEAYSANDDKGWNESMREERIITLFIKHDVEVEFIN
jgi:hypothetical protein